VEPEDEETLLAQWNDPDVRRFLFDDRPVSRAAVREQIARSRSTFAREGFGLLTLRLRERPAESIGFAGLARLGERPEVELLFALLPAFRGQGLATEAARAVLRLGFEEAALDEVLAGADPPNLASFRVMERLGMTFARDEEVGGRPVRYHRLARAAFLGERAT